FRNRTSTVRGSHEQTAPIACYFSHVQSIRARARAAKLHARNAHCTRYRFRPIRCDNRGENPFSGVIRGANDRCLIAQSLVLAEIEITEDNYHSKFVRTIDNAFEPLHVVRPQGAILRDGGIVPRLDKLTRVALCVPLASIWIRPRQNR